MVNKAVFDTENNRNIINLYHNNNLITKIPSFDEDGGNRFEKVLTRYDENNLIRIITTFSDRGYFKIYYDIGLNKDTNLYIPNKVSFETLRREISRFPAGYQQSLSEKLTKEQFESYAKIEALEKQVTAWEKTKEKIKKMLWWDDVAKGLAKLNQQNDTPPENGETTDTTTTPADTTPPAMLNADGKAWFMHPVAMMDYFKVEKKRGWAESPFALLLGKVESNNDYSAYNQTKPKLRAFFNTNLTSMTIEELIDKQSKKEIFAAGRFQIIPQTLKAAVAYLKLDLSLKYNKETQDTLFEEYLIKIKRKSIIKYLEHDGDVEDAIYDWAKEFASAGVRKGKTISGGRVAAFEGSSYYQGDGLNSAHILPDQMVDALIESKNGSW